jgi:hypothetical protein
VEGWGGRKGGVGGVEVEEGGSGGKERNPAPAAHSPAAARRPGPGTAARVSKKSSPDPAARPHPAVRGPGPGSAARASEKSGPC